MISTFRVIDLHAGEGDSQKQKLTIRRLILLGLSGVIILGTIYLGLLNRLSLMGYALQDVRAERYDLQTEVEKIEIELANESSLYSFGTNRGVQKLVPQKKPIFVSFQNVNDFAFNE